MINFFSHINWLSILAATIAPFVLGGLWFTLFFAKPYAIALGREREQKSPNDLIYILGPLVWCFITAVVSALLMKALGTNTLASALELGVVIGLGYLAATTINTGINPNIPRPLLYGILSGAYHLLATLLIFVILFFMQ